MFDLLNDLGIVYLSNFVCLLDCFFIDFIVFGFMGFKIVVLCFFWFGKLFRFGFVCGVFFIFGWFIVYGIVGCSF